MINLDKLLTHDFLNELIKDGNSITKGLKPKKGDYGFEDEPILSEYEFYVLNNEFYLIHLCELCKQLENAVELLSNFRYNSKDCISRGDHLTYNIENYIIRLTSLSDRIFQVINSTFHLGVDERDVNEKVILNNFKVSRTDLPQHYNNLRKTLCNYTGERNVIVHKHSHMDKQLRKIQMLYSEFITKEILKDETHTNHYVEHRKNHLKKFIAEKKIEFRNTNEQCFEKLIPIFDDMHKQYIKVKLALK